MALESRARSHKAWEERSESWAREGSIKAHAGDSLGDCLGEASVWLQRCSGRELTLSLAV